MNKAKSFYKLMITLLCSLFVTLSFTGCFFGFVTDDSGSEDLGEDDPNGDYMITLNSETSVTLSGVQGKAILYANFNASNRVINYPRYYTGASNYAIATGSITTFTPSASYVGAARTAIEPDVETVNDDTILKHFVPKEKFHVDTSSIPVSRTAIDQTSYNSFATTFNVGDEREFYVDNDVDMETYVLKNCVLAAKGTNANGTTVCLVWVDEDLYTQNGSNYGKNINQTMAQNLASKFGQYYEKERNVFGDEFESLFYTNGSWAGSLSDVNVCDTGPLVNIIVYDIGNDYTDSNDGNHTNSQTEECGVEGYFYSKDYFVRNPDSSRIDRYSNEGKYFYIDAAFCNYNGTAQNSAGKTVYAYNGISGNGVSGSVISTLFHEFQHMINFRQKANADDDPAWYNEMLSMLAEDMMQSELGLSDEEAPRGSRLPAFNQHYRYSGIDEMLEGRDAVISYATAYTFGAWLAREYGGTELVKEISQNSYVGMESIKNAIYVKTGYNFSTLQLFKMYLAACVFRPTFATNAAHRLPSHYKDGGNLIERFALTKINLFGSNYGYSVGGTTYYGPILYGPAVQLPVRPHGFVLHSIGTATTDTVTLNFSPRTNSGDQIVIFVQDAFSNTQSDTLAE